MTTRRTYNRFSGLLVGGLLYATGSLLSTGHAQFTTATVPDTTPNGNLGTIVTGTTDYKITGGTPGGTTNLFHSFQSFGVPSGGSADFIVPNNSVENVISRVNGTMGSQIDGKITSTYFDSGTNTFPISSASLWLINPNGILFGAGAQLDIGGSFHASTADYIKLGNDGIFYADPNAGMSILTSSPPSAFGFLTANPAPIDVQTGAFDFDTGELKALIVPGGETLSLVAGTVNVGASDGSAPGYLVAPDGRINLVGMGQGEATLDDANGFELNASGELGTTNIRGASIVDAKDVFIRGGRLVIDEAIIFPGVFGLGLPPDGGQVNVKVTNDVTITGTAPEPLTFVPPGIIVLAGSGVLPELFPDAKVPDITIDAQSVLLSGFVAVQNNRFGPGAPGDIEVKADTVRLENGAAIAVLNSYEGFGGNIVLDARKVELSSDGSPGAVGVMGLVAQSLLHPFFRGQLDPADPPDLDPRLTRAEGGNITVKATESLSVFGDALISSDSFSFGKSGDITIDAGDVFLTGTGPVTGAIGAQSFLVGDAGSVTINATGRIEVGGGFRITTSTGGSGNAGNVQITAGQPVTLSGTDSRILNSANQPPDEVLDALYQFTLFGGEDFASLKSATGIPNADLFNVLALLRDRGDIVLSDSELLPGNAGPVAVNTPLLTMNADTRVETSTGWGEFDPVRNEVVGNAGNVAVDVGSLFLNDGASIRSRSGAQLLTGELQVGAGNGGSINVSATDTISIVGRSPTSGEGSAVTTTTFGDGNGGNVSLGASNTVNIANGGSVSADSLSTEPTAGDTGSVTINAGNQIVMTNGSVSTRAVTSDGGNVALNAPNIINLTNSEITTSVESGVGGGGNINIDPEFLVLNNSQILANAFGGPGGNINIVAGNFIPSATSLVQASSALSTQGTIVVASPENNVAASIAQLPQNIVDVSGLLPEHCAARRAGTQSSSFTVAGRGGVPIDPDGYLPSFTAGAGSPQGSADVSPAASQAALQNVKHILLAMAGSGCTR